MNSKVYNQFEFIGKLSIHDDIYTVKEHQSGWETHRLNIGVKGDGLNSQKLDVRAMYSDTHDMYAGINTKWLHGEAGRWERVDWEDRLKSEVIDRASYISKYIIDVEENQDVKNARNTLIYKVNNLERKENLTPEEVVKLKDYKEEIKEKSKNIFEFITEYDFLLMLKDVIEVNRDKTFRVKGNAEWSVSNNNKIYLNYVPKLIEIVDENTENKLEVDIDIHFHKNSIVKIDENRVVVKGYIKEYLRDYRQNKLLPEDFIIDKRYLEGGLEQSDLLYDFIQKQFKVNDDSLMHLNCKVTPYYGAERVITKFQQDQLDLGIPEEIVFAGSRGVVGEVVNELRITSIMSGGLFKNGAVKVQLGEGGLEGAVLGGITTNSEENQYSQEINNSSDETDELLKKMEDLLNG